MTISTSAQKQSMISILLWPLVVLERIERRTWTVLVGLLFLVAGFSSHWLQVPSTLLSGFDRGNFRIVLIEPTEAFVLRMMVLIVAAVLIFGLIRGETTRFAVRFLVWALLTATLVFPYAVRLWDPEITFDSEVVWNGLDTVALTEMDQSYNAQQLDWRGDQEIVPLSSKSLMVSLGAPLAVILPGAPGGARPGPDGSEGRVGSPISDGFDLSIFRPARVADIMSELFGYSNAFFNLAGRGWHFTLIGAIVVLVGLYLPSDRGSLFFLRDMRWVAACWALLLVVLLTPRGISEALLAEAEVAIANGDNAIAEQDLRQAAFWKPPLRYTFLFHEKLGQLTRARNCDSCAESLLSVAYHDLLSRGFVEGIEQLEKFRKLYPDRVESRYWLGFAHVQRGIQLFDRGERSAASESWMKALQYRPTDAMALWGLALAQFHLRQFDAAARSFEAIVKLQNTVAFRPFPVTSQWRVAQAWAALQHGDVEHAHDLYSLSLTPENW